MIWLLIGAGGALGSVARHALNHVVHQRNLAATFPAGTFIVNVLGSVAIGVVAGLITSSRWSATYEMRTFVMVGLLGGFTTFSSFSLDTFVLLRDGQHLQALWNVSGQVALSLAGVWLGFTLARG